MPTIRSSESRIGPRLLLGLVVLTASAWGAGFWDKKHFSRWTENEVTRILMNSPWAKTVSISMGSSWGPPGGNLGRRGPGSAGGSGGGGQNGGGVGPAAGGSGSGGGRTAGGTPGGGGPGAGRRGGGGIAPVQMAPSINLLVRFEEALPVKHAKVKYNMGESTELTPEMQHYLEYENPHYVVAVEGLPAPMARFGQDTEQLRGTARLRRKKRDDVLPEKVEVRQTQSVIFQYFFPRSASIELADKEVEFVMKLERLGAARGQSQRGGKLRPGRDRSRRAGGLLGKEIKRRFRLKDMVYDGRLAL